MYTSENNWYYWQYNNGPKFGRKIIGDKFTTTFSQYTGTVGTFKEELLKAAKSTVDTYPTLTPCIFLSGGIDSELLLRSFLEIGAKPEVYIVRYENDYNIYDVSYAITICSILNIEYKLIEFNLKKFYENNAEKISEVSQSDRPRALPYCKFIELVDGLPILGGSDLTISRNNKDYSIKGDWVVKCVEHDISWSKYAQAINKPSIPEWYKWSPGLVLSFINLNWCKSLVNDEFIGKMGTNSTKILGYKEAYSDLIDRQKKTGLEKVEFLIKEFEEFLIKKNNGLHYRDTFDRKFSNLEKEIRGSIHGKNT